jgi:hypothetical protein
VPWSGTWNSPGFFGFGARAEGHLACWVSADGNARLTWTITDAPIVSAIRGNGADIAVLFEAWKPGSLLAGTKGR